MKRVGPPTAYPSDPRAAARSHAGWGPLLLGLCTLVWLTGCATSADPHAGGFVSGVVGLAGGGYQRRIDEREGAYQTELDASERLKRQAQALERERAQVRGDLSRAQSRLASQERRIAQERARLSAQRTADAQARLRQLDQAQAKVAGAQGEIRAVRPEEQPVDDLKARSQDIRKELDEIDRMVGVVSESRF
ncbi:MAG: hypothetical protein ACM3ST_05860 [Bdellovibrio bacteriovorus]